MPSALVIGGGVSGLTSAITLAEAGVQVSLIERGAIGQESSWAGAGILSPLPPWGYGPELTALAEYSIRLWPQWIEKLADDGDTGYWSCGMLVRAVRDTATAQAWLKVHPSTHTPPAPWQLAPDDLWLPDVAQIRNPRLIQALVQHARKRGIAIMEHCTIAGWKAAGTRVQALQTDQGDLHADHFIVAAGAWTPQVLGELAGGIAVFPVRGQILLLQSQPGTVPAILLQDNHYLVPRRDGLVLVGSTLESVGFNKDTTEDAKAALHAFAREAVPELAHAPIVRQWAGLRPGSVDNIPTIGRHPALENLHANCGHFRYGVTLAPASAALLAAQILGHEPPLPTAPYAWPTKSA